MKFLPALSLLRAWLWFLPPACLDLSSPACLHPLSSATPSALGLRLRGSLLLFFIFNFFATLCSLQDLRSPDEGLNLNPGSESTVLTTGPPGNSPLLPV